MNSPAESLPGSPRTARKGPWIPRIINLPGRSGRHRPGAPGGDPRLTTRAIRVDGLEILIIVSRAPDGSPCGGIDPGYFGEPIAIEMRGTELFEVKVGRRAFRRAPDGRLRNGDGTVLFDQVARIVEEAALELAR